MVVERTGSRIVAVVTSEPSVTRALARDASALGHRVLAFSSPAVARETLVLSSVDVVLAVRRMSPIDGCQLADDLLAAHGDQRPAFVLMLDPTDIFDTGDSFDAVLPEVFDRARVRDAIDRALAARASARSEHDEDIARALLGAPRRR